MATVPFSHALKKEYETLFNACAIRQEGAAEVQRIVDRFPAQKCPMRIRG
jgi:lysozyme family protein